MPEFCGTCQTTDYAICPGCGSHFQPPGPVECFDCREETPDA